MQLVVRAWGTNLGEYICIGGGKLDLLVKFEAEVEVVVGILVLLLDRLLFEGEGRPVFVLVDELSLLRLIISSQERENKYLAPP